jgi:hypothetical protein
MDQIAKNKESANKEWHSIQPLASGPFPLKEKAYTGRFSSNLSDVRAIGSKIPGNQKGRDMGLLTESLHRENSGTT